MFPMKKECDIIATAGLCTDGASWLPFREICKEAMDQIAMERGADTLVAAHVAPWNKGIYACERAWFPQRGWVVFAQWLSQESPSRQQCDRDGEQVDSLLDPSLLEVYPFECMARGSPEVRTHEVVFRKIQTLPEAPAGEARGTTER
jgi:hypothetical protein